jgi:hypothetical protein
MSASPVAIQAHLEQIKALKPRSFFGNGTARFEGPFIHIPILSGITVLGCTWMYLDVLGCTWGGFLIANPQPGAWIGGGTGINT